MQHGGNLEDGRDKFVTGFHLLIFKSFFFQDTCNLKSKLRHAVLHVL